MTPDKPNTPPPFPVEPVPPDLLAWARQTLNVEEILKEIREVQANGGFTLDEFFHEIEAAVKKP